MCTAGRPTMTMPLLPLQRMGCAHLTVGCAGNMRPLKEVAAHISLHRTSLKGQQGSLRGSPQQFVNTRVRCMDADCGAAEGGKGGGGRRRWTGRPLLGLKGR